MKSLENTQMEEPVLSGMSRGRTLIFVAEPSAPASWIETVRALQKAGHRSIGVRLFDNAARKIADTLAKESGLPIGILEASNAPAESQNRVDAVLLIGGDADQISTALLDYLDEKSLTIAAPVTDRYWQKLPLYLISIPKAGTHLLFQLAEALGYAMGGLRQQQPAGGHWYYLLNSNAHTTAPEFFRDELQKAPFGNRAHPFMHSPALFNYRNPLDILVSEANYWHIDGNSPLSVLLSPLTFEERVERLLDNRWSLGTIRDRVGAFAAWLDCSNVVPVSFEEMVGDTGGGSNEVLESLIWSLQLKLHVPGSPDAIRQAMSDRSSPTFREGRINGWREKLPTPALELFKSLPQDFMKIFGYDVNDDAGQSALPKHADGFRRRPLRLMTVRHLEVPFLVETDYLGYNVVSYQGRYYAVAGALGKLDLTQLSSEQLANFPNAQNLSSLRALIATKEVERAVLLKMQAPERKVNERLGELEREVAEMERAVVGTFLRYNLFRTRDGLMAIPMRLGAVDPLKHELRSHPDVILSRHTLLVRLRILWAWIRWAYWDGVKV